MALGVAKERVAQEKKYPNDPSAGIGLILFGLAKQEIGGKAEVVNKTETRKKNKTKKKEGDQPKKEWIVKDDGSDYILNESTDMDEVKRTKKRTQRLIIHWHLSFVARYSRGSACLPMWRPSFARTGWRT